MVFFTAKPKTMRAAIGSVKKRHQEKARRSMKERATNKQHGMCFVEKSETILYEARQEEKKLELGLSRSFGFLDCPSQCVCLLEF